MDGIVAWLKRIVALAYRAFLPLGLVLAFLLAIVGGVQDVTGGAGFLSLTPSQLVTVALALFVFFGVLAILRHEYLLYEVENIYGNEHARKLWASGIPPVVDSYLQYVRQGDYAIVNRFWDAGFANILKDGKSDLHIACENGHAAIAEGIIRHGGDPKRPDKQGLTPLMHAARGGHLKVMDALAQHDAAINAKSSEHGISALFLAAASGKLDTVKVLVGMGAEIDAVDHNNKTPLLAALCRHHHDIAEYLLERGANVTRVDADGANAMDYAKAFRAPESVIKLLQQRGVKASEPPFYSTGGGYSYTGKVDVKWTRTPPKGSELQTNLQTKSRRKRAK